MCVISQSPILNIDTCTKYRYMYKILILALNIVIVLNIDTCPKYKEPSVLNINKSLVLNINRLARYVCMG